MCGIAGFSGSFDEGLLSRMNHVVRHRGPDDGGLYYRQEDQVGLAHRRLSIIDITAAGHQPMWDTSKSVVIVFNGEIYNFHALRAQLIRDGFRFHSHTDTEVLLNLYLQKGEALLEDLNGIFAFALYDMRKRQLFIARDHVGVKPLYYSNTDKGFIFSSELKALLQEPSVCRDLNPRAIANHLRYLWSPGVDTMLTSIKKLLPGHAMIVKEGKIQRMWQFYDLPYENPIASYSVDQACDLLRSKFKAAVERQLVADVPVGAFLSGGLDSSAIVAMAKQLHPGLDLQCFTMTFDQKFGDSEGTVDDLPFARSVADYFGVKLHVVHAASDIIQRLEFMLYHLDEPQADPAALNTFLIAELARAHGMKVLLSGVGGDDIFTGYRRHYALMQERYWAWLPQGMRSMMVKLATCLPERIAWLRRVKKIFQYADLETDQRLTHYFYWLSPKVQDALYSQALRDRLHSLKEKDALVASLNRLGQETPLLNRMLYLEGKYFLPDHNLNYTDKMAMAAGVEVRVPFLDVDLIDFATRLPIGMKQHGACGKWIFKKAMESYLPKNIIYRRKTGFGAPLRYWVRHDLQFLINDVLSAEAITRRGLFDPKRVAQLIQDNASGKIDGAYTIFSLLCIEYWCRMFLDKR